MTVVHEESETRFVLSLPEGVGELRYRVITEGVLDLYHTEVDPGLRGRGVAGVLAQAAFTYARIEGLKVEPTCAFLPGWLAKHPQEQDLVAVTA